MRRQSLTYAPFRLRRSATAVMPVATSTLGRPGLTLGIEGRSRNGIHHVA